MAGRKKTSVNYLSNENILTEIRASKERLRTANIPLTPTEALTPGLVKMIRMIVHGVSLKYNWRNYSYIEDMKAEAEYALSKNALKFNEEKTQNPFSYYTQIVWSSFISFVENEKKLGRVRDAILEDLEMTPSFRRQMENEEEQRGENAGRREMAYKKTAEDERLEQALKASLEACNEVAKLLKGDTSAEGYWALLGEKMTLAFDRPVDPIFLVADDADFALNLFPLGTCIDINRDVPAEYNVAALIVVETTNNTKLMKGIGRPGDVELPQDKLTHMYTTMALAVRKDTLIAENKHVLERALKYSASKPSDAAPKVDDNGNVETQAAPKKRPGRKPKVSALA